MAEERARARTLARAQAVAEKLSAATGQVGSAITETNGAVVELEKTMHTIAAGAEQSSTAAEESRAAINQIVKASDVANGRSDATLQLVSDLQALAKTTTAAPAALLATYRRSLNTLSTAAAHHNCPAIEPPVALQ